MVGLGMAVASVRPYANICTSLQPGNHANASVLSYSFDRLNAFPGTQLCQCTEGSSACMFQLT